MKQMNIKDIHAHSSRQLYTQLVPAPALVLLCYRCTYAVAILLVPLSPTNPNLPTSTESIFRHLPLSLPSQSVLYMSEQLRGFQTSVLRYSRQGLVPWKVTALLRFSCHVQILEDILIKSKSLVEREYQFSLWPEHRTERKRSFTNPM